jgi:serine phosphatase RsbU (regulator of sigma subunit)
MGQLRNLLRGVAQTLDGPPARILDALDEAMHTLGLDVFATAVLAEIDPGEPRTLRWSDAGHPPPVLIARDGSARLLDGPVDVALGLRSSQRRDHAVALEPGASVVFYTDGLIERRGQSLDDGLARLLASLEGHPAHDAEGLCERLAALRTEPQDDDVALLVVTVLDER